MNLSPERRVGKLRALLEEHADPEYGARMKSYLRGQFEFFGMRSPERNVIFKEFIEKHGLPSMKELPALTDALFGQEQREFHYFAIEIAGRNRPDWKEDSIALFESMAVRRSWWDSVDYICRVCLHHYFLRFPDARNEITEGWIESGNIWLQRLSVIFQLGYKEHTDTALLERNISRLTGSDEFFVQKGIGWVLRDYARTDPDFVIGIVERLDLKPLSKREALKRIARKS